MTKYVFNPKQTVDEVRVISDMDDLQDITGVGVGSRVSGWCYLKNITQVDDIPHDMVVSDLLQFLSENNKEHLLQFSVASHEDRYQEFLDAISGVPGHNIIPFKRMHHGDEYTVYLCTFPTSPEM